MGQGEWTCAGSANCGSSALRDADNIFPPNLPVLVARVHIGSRFLGLQFLFVSSSLACNTRIHHPNHLNTSSTFNFTYLRTVLITNGHYEHLFFVYIIDVFLSLSYFVPL
jgi:hypothetical protein